jgi:putative transposase
MQAVSDVVQDVLPDSSCGTHRRSEAPLSRVEACAALGIPRASYYRDCARRALAASPAPPEARPRTPSPRALSTPERDAVLALLRADEFADLAVPQVWATTLDRGQYLCSQRTMYRILGEHGEVRERRDQLRRPVYAKPELLATAPNQVWSWDITKLKGPRKWTYFYLYVVLDIFSRYVVGWTVSASESAETAKTLVSEATRKQGIAPGQVVLHADRGAPMTARTFSRMLVDLGIAESHGRPHVSDDNCYSEAHFKTLKYRPDFPDRFGCIEDALGHCRAFFHWYHFDHRHSGLGWMTPTDVHHGLASAVHARRAVTLDAAFRLHPERFVSRPPTPPQLPSEVWINKPASAVVL